MQGTHFDGLYFDGQSSKSHAVKVEFDAQLKLCLIQISPDELIKWSFSELSIFEGPDNLDIRLTDENSVYVRLKLSKEQIKVLYALLAKKNIHFHFRQFNKAQIIIVALFLMVGLITAYFVVLPPLAEKVVTWLPTTVDDQIGAAAYDAIVDKGTLDQNRSKILNEFAAELNLANKRPLHFNVVRSKEVNAFALPNGEIVVFSSLLKKLESPAQLVALIGHEVSHVNERHSMKLLSRNLAGYLVISLLLGDVSGMTAVLTDNAQQLQQLSYSRSNEEQADALGFQILIRNNQDPKGMLQLFEKLKAESSDDIPEMLSTHPLPNARIKHIKNLQLSCSSKPVKKNPKLELLFKRLK